MRQITGGPYQDIHPFYLPDGKIGFVSTRVKAYTMCQPGAACALHVAEPDGTNIRRIHFGTLADHSPYVLDNGSILFTRWEYQDKDLTYLQGLWTVNPDGTRVQLFFGNTIYDADYQAMLAAIVQGKEELYKKPRVDMPGAKPLPYPRNHAGPFTGFAGP